MADPSVLSSPAYARAFEQVMRGVDPALLADDERQALVDARASAGVTGPGYPMPTAATVHDVEDGGEVREAFGVARGDVAVEGGADGA